LRDSSAEHTIAGGEVLQPQTGKIRRRHFEILERIEKLCSDLRETRAETVAWFARYHGFTESDLVRGAGIHPAQAADLQRKLQAAGLLQEIPASGHSLLMHSDRLRELEERILEVLGRMHRGNALMTSHDRQKVLSQLDYVGDEALLQGVVDRLIKSKQLVGDGHRIARADFKPKLSINQRKLKDKMVAAHLAAQYQPPDPGSFAAHAGGNASALKDIYDVAVAEGLLVRVTDEIYLHAEVETQMRQQIRERLQTGPGLTVAEIRDLLGTTRKFAVPLCEYLDRIGLTKRQGDLRVLA
jgi:selenocysteine-specific elongation factor